MNLKGGEGMKGRWMLVGLIVSLIAVSVQGMNQTQEVLPSSAAISDLPTCQLIRADGSKPFLTPVAVTRYIWNKPPHAANDTELLASIAQLNILSATNSLTMLKGLMMGEKLFGWV